MAQPSSEDLTEIASDPGAVWIGSWRSVQVIVWIKGATLNAVQCVDRAALVRNEGDTKSSIVHLITPGAGPPEPNAREAFIEVTRRYGESVASAGVIIERSGLLGMAVRSAVTGMIILAPKHYRVKVFDSIDDCAPWLSEQHERVTGTLLRAAELSGALHKARSIALPA